MIHTSRVMLCVLVEFFLPGMARPNSQEKCTKIEAIGLIVFIDIFYELNSVHNSNVKSTMVSAKSKPVNELSFFISGAIISITLIWLILLLISAAMASKIIGNITTQKIPMILGEPAENS